MKPTKQAVLGAYPLVLWDASRPATSSKRAAERCGRDSSCQNGASTLSNGNSRTQKTSGRRFGGPGDKRNPPLGRRTETLLRSMNMKMKALVKREPHPGLWLEEVPTPSVGVNDV